MPRIASSVFLAFLLLSVYIVGVGAADAPWSPPRPTPRVGSGGFPEPIDWPCLADGWQAGDRFGPGAMDVVPSADPCPVVPIPMPSGDSEAMP